MENIEINEQFEQVLNFVNQTNKSVFITGKAGTGKTTLLKYIKSNTFKQLAIIAPTGVAAINAGGSTIHSFFQFSFGPFLPNFTNTNQINYLHRPLHVQKYNINKINLLKRLDLLIIDEISMVRSDMIDQIDVTLRQVRKNYKRPFGGVQVLFIGDMFQLPPIVSDEEWRTLVDSYKSAYFFDSYAVRENYPVFIELTKIYRQKENKFVEILNEVRNNKLSLENLNVLNACYNRNLTKLDYESNITLTTHNRKADTINQSALNALSSKLFTYKSAVEGLFSEKTYPADEVLLLKVGARVMFLKNNSEKNYYNGKIGIVTALEKDSITVKCEEDFAEIKVEKEVWSNVTYDVDKSSKEIKENVIGKFIQFPLRHAWAITIHKSQGLTFDKLIIDAAEAFSAGQVYVALSRCRSLSGLILSSEIDSKKLFNNDEIVAFNNSRQDDATIKNLFSASQLEFTRECIQFIFDFSILAKTNKELLGLCALHKKHFAKAGINWTTLLAQKINQICDTSLKFEAQLHELFNDFETKQEFINQRISKASAYFDLEITNALTLLKNCDLITESKEAASDCNQLLQEIFDYLSDRSVLITSCINGFNLQLYSKAKLKDAALSLKMNIYATAKKQIKTATASQSAHTNHPILYKRLVELRDELCEETQKPIFFVANAKTITQLCDMLPINSNQLLKISGFGQAKVNAFGDRFLDLINNYIAEFNVETNELVFEETVKKEKIKTQKTDSKKQSFELYQQGNTIEEIAKIRNFTHGTIINHLLPYIVDKQLDVHQFVSKENFDLIQAALIKSEEPQSLNEIKNSLPNAISFEEIKIVKACLGKLF